VTDLPDVSLRPSNPSWSRAAFGTFIALDNAAFVRAARAHGAHVLPFSAISRESEANRAPYVSSDGLHPSAAGYAKLADALWPSFEAALRPERSFKQKRS
jgi:lysophospholipase L1-like esterase